MLQLLCGFNVPIRGLKCQNYHDVRRSLNVMAKKWGYFAWLLSSSKSHDLFASLCYWPKIVSKYWFQSLIEIMQIEAGKDMSNQKVALYVFGPPCRWIVWGGFNTHTCNVELFSLRSRNLLKLLTVRKKFLPHQQISLLAIMLLAILAEVNDVFKYFNICVHFE